MRRFAVRTVLTAALLAGTAGLAGMGSASAAEPQWRNLIQGNTLAGWRVLGGTAPYAVENGEIVGRSIAKSKNSFLSTTESFGDFILEYEARVDPKLNSGVMIRGQVRPDGDVYGYQAELDSTPRAWSGGIYDEQRRQWLYNLVGNDAARHAFKPGEWNRFRVEAIGTHIRTFVNGVPAANLVDDADARGTIGLQVHAVKDEPGMIGLEAHFRNVRIATAGLTAAATPPDALPEYSFLANRLTPAERKAGWRLLWDGKTTRGWHGVKLKTFPDHGWNVRDGMLTVAASEGLEARAGGDIVTDENFSNFELEADFRLTPGANSGIKYFVDPGLNKGAGSAIGLEFQLLDDARHPDAKLGRDGNRTLGSLYDLIAAKNLSEPGGGPKRFNAPGEWNRARLVVRGSHVEHWLNGVKLVEYERGSPGFRALVAASKYKDWANFGELPSGPILLQDHGNEVAFRSIKIRTLNP